MEMTKAENLVEHGAEIFAKPARTWFQTQRQKQEIAQAEKVQAAAAEPASQRSKREKEAERNALKRKRGVEQDSTNHQKKSKLMQVYFDHLTF